MDEARTSVEVEQMAREVFCAYMLSDDFDAGEFWDQLLERAPFKLPYHAVARHVLALLASERRRGAEAGAVVALNLYGAGPIGHTFTSSSPSVQNAAAEAMKEAGNG